jgi:hypothetical protein
VTGDGTAETAGTGTTSSRGLLVGLALGLPVIGYGIAGAVADADLTHPPELARWVVGAAVAIDLVLVPLVGLAGWAARRVTPRRAWPAVRAGLVVTGALLLVGYPVVRGDGRDPGNPSLLPRDYAAGLGAAIAVVWSAVAAALILAALRRGRTRRAAARRRTPSPSRPSR